MKMATALVILLLVAGLMSGMVGCGGAEAKELKIGVVGPQTHPLGQTEWQAAQIAAGEINDAGGLRVGEDTYTLNLVKVDTNELNSVTDAVSAVEQVITVDGASFLVGGMRSEAVSAMQDLAMSHKAIFLGTCAASTALCTKVTDDYSKYKYWFRVLGANSACQSADYLSMLDMVADKFRSETGIMTPKVALLIEKTVFADYAIADAQAKIPEMGMEIVGTWRPSPNASDLTAELTAIDLSGAQIIYNVLTGPASLVYSKKWGEMQIPAAPVGVCDMANHQTFWDATGGKGNYMVGGMYIAPGVSVSDKTAPFADKYEEEWGVWPGFGAGAYDAIYVLKEAIERAGSLDTDAIVAELEKTDHIGTFGRIRFTQSHDVGCGFGNVTMIGTQWQDGVLKGVWPPADGSWHGVKYEGIVDYVLPPWVVEEWKQ